MSFSFFTAHVLFIELITRMWFHRFLSAFLDAHPIDPRANPIFSVVDEYQLLARKQFLESDGEEAIIKNCKAEAMQKTWGGRAFLEEPHESDADLIANADTNGLSK